MFVLLSCCVRVVFVLVRCFACLFFCVCLAGCLLLFEYVVYWVSPMLLASCCYRCYVCLMLVCLCLSLYYCVVFVVCCVLCWCFVADVRALLLWGVCTTWLCIVIVLFCLWGVVFVCLVCVALLLLRLLLSRVVVFVSCVFVCLFCVLRCMMCSLVLCCCLCVVTWLCGGYLLFSVLFECLCVA